MGSAIWCIDFPHTFKIVVRLGCGDQTAMAMSALASFEKSSATSSDIMLSSSFWLLSSDSSSISPAAEISQERSGALTVLLPFF